MQKWTSVMLLVLGLAACNKIGEPPSLRIGDPGQGAEEREIFQDRGEVCTPELEAKGKCRR